MAINASTQNSSCPVIRGELDKKWTRQRTILSDKGVKLQTYMVVSLKLLAILHGNTRGIFACFIDPEFE